MAIKILRKPGAFAIALLVSNFFFVINADGQDAVGDYRSNATNFNWATVGSWQICSAAGTPGTFVTSTTYPGQNAGTPTVTIRSSQTATLNLSPANSIGALVITGGLNGSTSTLSISGNFTNNGTFTTGTSTIILNGSNAAIIAGTATTNFYNLTVNKTAASTTVTNSQAVFASTNNLTVTQGNLTLSANNGDYNFKNVIVSTNGTITHTVPWDVAPNRKIGVTGNFDVTGIFNPTVRSHVNLNSAGTKTIRTGDNPASTLSILTFSDGTYNANGTLKTNQEVWAMFGTTGSFNTAGNNVTFSSMNNYNGTVNVNGGSLSINGGCEVGYAATNGVINVSSGLFSIGGDLLIDATGKVVCTNSPSINIGGNFTNNGTYTKATETVNLNGGNQTIGGSSAINFNDLTLSGSGTKNFGAARAISGNLSITSGVKANLGTFVSSANTLTLGGAGVLGGSWGSSASPATHINDTYFATAGTGIINISSSTCVVPVAGIAASTNITCNGANDGSITIMASGGTSPYTFSINNGTYIAGDTGDTKAYNGLLPNTPYQIKVKDFNGCISK